MNRYPERLHAALIIDRSWSFCGACGRGAYPEQEIHADLAGWHPERGSGCGVKWTHVSSNYSGDKMKEGAMDMRPDLEWIDMFPNMSVPADRPSDRERKEYKRDEI